MQFNMVVCGLDSIEARRWINATLVGMVDFENPESLKPLIDGGTEGRFIGRKHQTSLILNRIQRPSACDFTDNDIVYRVPA